MKTIKSITLIVAFCLFLGLNLSAQTRHYFYLPGTDAYNASMYSYQDGQWINNIGLRFELEEGGPGGASVRRYISMSRAGNLGIGLGPFSPRYRLHVSTGDDYQIGIRLDQGKLSLGGGSQFEVDASGVPGGRFKIYGNGQVTIGQISPGSFHLAVDGKIGAREIVVTMANPFPDYVFENTYTLRPLSQVESFIKENKHLPEIPSAKEVKANGINLGEMDALLLKKIEELTLYMIDINKKMEEMRSENNQLKEQLNRLNK